MNLRTWERTKNEKRGNRKSSRRDLKARTGPNMGEVAQDGVSPISMVLYQGLPTQTALRKASTGRGSSQ